MAQHQHTIVPVMAVVLVACHCISTATPASPAPAVDCSSLVLTMADCLSFVSNGSTVDKPEGTCCSGLKDVLKTDAECLCDAFRSSAQLGVILNVSKALALPAACKVPAASANKCDLTIAPASSPVLSPESSPPADEASSAPSSAAPAAAVDDVSAPVPAWSIGLGVGVTSGSFEIIAPMWLSLASSLLFF